MITEKIIETKKCKRCQLSFAITDKDIHFYDMMSPTFSWKKYPIPSPTLCPDCRFQRRYARRNERHLYKRKCDFSGETIITMYSPDAIFPVYQNKYRWKDGRDPFKYGRDFGFSKTFGEQFKQLQNQVPRAHRFSYVEERMFNAEYNNCSWDLKNCYLTFATWESEDTYYTDHLMQGYECMDILLGHHCHQCYECINVENCFSVFYSQDCFDCHDSRHLNDCVNCGHCIGCVGLRNQNYCILNKTYTKEEFEKEKNKILDGDGRFAQDFLDGYHQLYLEIPKKYMHGNNNEHAIGDAISNSKNVYHSFEVSNAEEIKYCAHFFDGKNCMDFFARGEAERCYEIAGWGQNAHNYLFSAMIFGGRDSLYNDFCFYCENCLGCVWLHNQKYCIFNKQYTKDEYEKWAGKIIEHMQITGERGEFFPLALSPFAYNESCAIDYYPLSRKEALAQWYQRLDKEYPLNVPDNLPKIKADELPPIRAVTEDILEKLVLCEVSWKPFKIIKPELEFYRKHIIPLPKRHPDQRYLERFQMRNPRKLRDRKCMKCWTGIKTSYAPERKELVYCEDCYNKEIYG